MSATPWPGASPNALTHSCCPAFPSATRTRTTASAVLISFSFQTLDAVVKDIVYSLLDQGFRRIALINHNGGNIMVKPTCREINLSQDKGKVVHLLPSQVAAESLSTIIESLHEEVHAGEFETSLMMHLAPEQVGPQRIDHVPDVEWAELDYRPLRDICPDGVWGRPSLATAEKGRLGLEMVIEATATEFEETFARLGVPAR